MFHAVVQTSDVGLPVDDAQQGRFRVSHQNVLQQVAIDVHDVDFGAQMNRFFCFDHIPETVHVLPVRFVSEHDRQIAAERYCDDIVCRESEAEAS